MSKHPWLLWSGAIIAGLVAVGGCTRARPDAAAYREPPRPYERDSRSAESESLEESAPAEPEGVAGDVGGTHAGPAKQPPASTPAPAKPAPATPPPLLYKEKKEVSKAEIPPEAGNDDFDKDFGREPPRGNRFAELKPNPFVSVERDRLSTFAVDVDTASYSLARRYINEGALPPPQAVRVEEFVNYFKYHYASPEQGSFAVDLEGAPSPFTAGYHLLRIGLQGKVVSRSQRKQMNLVFLVDTSGSMDSEDKLPLAREAIKIAVKNLNENDTVAIVTYAGSVRDVLPPTPANERARITAAVDSLLPGGGTSMGSGLELAYKHAVKKAAGSVVSRVVVLTDGDTNIGPNLTPEAMFESVKKYVAEGVTLSTIGFGMGNYRDDLMEKLADRGNGNCFYIDSHREAKKVFEAQLVGTMQVIAKDVKVQVEFNPKTVRTYRLVGYENRDIADRDFRNDKVDAGEIGAGHSVTALYEVQLSGAEGNLATVRIRAKEPNGTEAKEQAFPFGRDRLRQSLEAASGDFRFAVAVAGTADVLRRSQASESWNLATAEKLAQGALDGSPERAEFVELLRKVRPMWAAQHRVASGR